MKTIITNQQSPQRRWMHLALLLVLVAALGAQAIAQTANQYVFTASSGTFTPLVGATSAPGIATTEDDNISSNITIGFSFGFAGSNYSQLRVSSNGHLVFGTSGANNGGNNLSTTTASTRPGIAPLWDDNQCTAGIKYQLSGVAPNQVFTIEWLNMEWNYQTTTPSISFQVKLYEGTNEIEVIYRQEATAVGTGSGGASIGIMGTSSNDFISLQNTSASPTISTTTSTNNLILKPATGQIYKFSPPPPCTGVPPVGTLSLDAATTCANNFTINQSFPGVTGITYQWQSATAIGGPYSNVLTAGNSINYSAVAPSTTTYYQCIVTCTSSGGSDTTLPIAVNPPVINGGSANISAAPGCAAPGFSLNITGATTGTLTYQWQDSIPGGAWAATTIATASTTNTTLVATANVATPTYFRRQTICVSSSVTSNSNPVLVDAVFGGTAASTNAICGDSITLSVTGNTSGAGVTFQWESSTDTIAWSPIPAATAASQKVVSPSDITYYRCQVICTTPFAYSTWVKVLPVKGGTTTLTSNFCGDSTTLGLSGATAGSVSYSWLSSTDSLTWTVMPGLSGSTAKFPAPTSTQYYRTVVSCGSHSDTSIAVRVNEPCQGFGPYSITRSTAVPFTSIQGTGNTYTWVGTSGDDDRTRPVYFPAGFNFTYGGVVRPAFYACTNGWISLDTTIQNNSLGNDLSVANTNAMIAPFWEDLVVLGNNAANRTYMKYEVTGVTPNRIMTIEWAEMERYLYGSPSLSFQVKLYEGSNNVEFVYGKMQAYDGSGTGDFTYSLGMSGASPANGQKLALLVPNTSNFSSTTVNNNLTIVPLCNTSYLFTNGGVFNPTATSNIPTNDSSATPTVLSVNPIPCTDGCGTYYTSLNATASNVGPNPVSGNADDDVWFQFVAPVSGQVNINLIASSGYNPAFMVMNDLFDTTGLGDAGSRNAASNALESVVATGLTGGNTYLIRVFNAGAGAGSTSGSFSICVNEVIPPPANDDTTGAILLTANPTYMPTAGTTLAATASTQAVCGGLADDDVWFKFVPNNYSDTISITGTGTFRAHVQVLTAGMVSLACQNTNTNAGTVKFVVNNLKKDSTYFIRVYHTNAGTATANFNIGVYNDNGQLNDLQAVTVTRPVQQTCFAVNDSVFVRLRNVAFDSNPYDFAINNATVNVVITDPNNTTTTISNTLVAGTINPNADTVVFVGTFNFTIGGTYSFRANVDEISDPNANNDTSAIVTRVNNVFTIPYVNNFETPTELSQGSSTGFFVSPGNGINTSQGLRYNFYATATTAQITSIRLSGATSASAFSFKYRITNWTGGGATILGTNDSLVLEVSTDCGATFTGAGYINGSNHTPSTDFASKIMNLGPFAPSEMIVRIRGNWTGTSNDAYVDIDSFYVYDAVVPTVATTATTNLSDISADVSGNITNNGGGAVSMSGVVVSTTPSPAKGDPGVIDVVTSPNVAFGNFTVSITGLTPSTQYHYRAYAINGAGTSYGIDSTFTTLSAPVLSTVNSIAASAINPTTVTVGGNIIFNGGSVITASGIVYGTSPMPAIGDPGVVDSTTSPVVASGMFSINPIGLTPGTKYYFRAYAINSVGTSYSTEDSFTTSPIISTLPYAQNFESGAEGWVTGATGGANNWVLGTPAKGQLSSAASGVNAWVTNLATDYVDNHNAAVVSPQFDFTTATTDPIIRFKHNFNTETGWDAGVIEISINNGAWTKLDNNQGTGVNFNTPNSYSWYNSASNNGPMTPAKWSGLSTNYSSVNPSNWIKSSTYLTGAAGQANVKIRFRFASDGGGTDEGWAIDDIEILELATPSLTASSPSVLNIANNTMDVSWTNGNGNARVVVARLTANAAVAPKDSVAYVASPVFGVGNTTGANNYVVYNGTGTSVSVSGLTILSDYTFDVYEYNGEDFHVMYTTAVSTNGVTLPVTLTSFAANVKGADAILTWTTASEINNSGFEVQRSVDGRNFEKAAFVKGAGNSNKALNYSLTDAKAFAVAKSNVVYYRLKQIDFDGKYTYSQVVRVAKNAEAVNALSVYPNPYASAYSVSFTAAKEGMATIEMVDLQGKVVATKSAAIINGNNMVPMTEVTNLEAGVYFVRLTVNGETQMTKLVKN